MYLRKNRVRCGDTHRIYLSIAHNVWWCQDALRGPQSRPVVLASFGVADGVDHELAHELVEVVERCVPRLSVPRGKQRAATLAVAQTVRQIEPFLKVLAGRRLALREHVRDAAERMRMLEALVRDRLSDPARPAAEDEIVRRVRSYMEPCPA